MLCIRCRAIASVIYILATVIFLCLYQHRGLLLQRRRCGSEAMRTWLVLAGSRCLGMHLRASGLLRWRTWPDNANDVSRGRVLCECFHERPNAMPRRKLLCHRFEYGMQCIFCPLLQFCFLSPAQLVSFCRLVLARREHFVRGLYRVVLVNVDF